MKKITSITLCLLLVFSTAFCLLLSPTSAAADDTTQTSNRISTNLVADGGFDAATKNTTESPFRSVNASRVAGSKDEWFTKIQSSSGLLGCFVNEEADGNKCVLLNRALFQAVDVQSNMEYSVSLKVRAEGENVNTAAASSIYVRLLSTGGLSERVNVTGTKTEGAKNTANGNYEFAIGELSTTEWKTYTFTLKTGTLMCPLSSRQTKK